MVVSLFTKPNHSTDLKFHPNTLSRQTNIIVSLYQRVIHRRQTIKNDLTCTDAREFFDKGDAISSECGALVKPILNSNLSPRSSISCTSKFDAENKYVAVVTIAMVLTFAPKSADIDPRYYSDFKKISNFFCDCSKIMVLFEGCGFGSEIFNKNPMAQLRFNNMAKYLFDNFEVSPSHFCPINSYNFIRAEEHMSDLDLQDTYQVKFLFSYQNLSETHRLIDQ